jgi:enolase-phosphatase E1
MNQKRNSSELKQIQILAWVWGYEKGLLKGHVFDDVPQAMHNWKTKLGIKLCTYSSGMVAAFVLLFDSRKSFSRK